MIDLRNYADLIRQLVAEEDEKDPNWKWSVKSIGKDKVRIRWGYLDYLEEKDNCFILEMDNDTDDSGIGDWLWARLPHGNSIECYLVVEGDPDPEIGAEQNIQTSIRDAIREIAHYAHNRY